MELKGGGKEKLRGIRWGVAFARLWRKRLLETNRIERSTGETEVEKGSSATLGASSELFGLAGGKGEVKGGKHERNIEDGKS